MIELGNHSYACNPQFRGSMSNVIVGNYTSIAEGCVFDCGFNHNIKNVTTFPLHKLDASLPSNIKNRGDVVIGNDCYIGERCVIMSGVTIGDGAVIGANTVVRKDVQPYFVYMNHDGFWRFESKWIRECLLAIAWWNWPDSRVLANAHLLLSENIDNFIENHI